MNPEAYSYETYKPHPSLKRVLGMNNLGQISNCDYSDQYYNPTVFLLRFIFVYWLQYNDHNTSTQG